MAWSAYLSVFFAGAFFANSVPHLVNGISGNKFPTPFAKPRGVGLSSSTTNVLWALFNIFIGLVLLRSVSVIESLYLQALFFAGAAFMSIFLSIRFRSKHKE